MTNLCTSSKEIGKYILNILIWPFKENLKVNFVHGSYKNVFLKFVLYKTIVNSKIIMV